jgi:hypothetical protein
LAIAGNLKLHSVFTLLIMLSCFLLAQDAELLEDDIALPDQTLLQETIDALRKNPININSANYDDLIKIPYLTPILVNQILQARKDKNQFNSISELLSIPGIDSELLAKIRPLLTLRQPAKITGQFRTRLKLDTLDNINKTEDIQIANRANVIVTQPDYTLRAVINTDKDKKETGLADFFSTSISITTQHSKLVLGNYLLSFGSHLVFASPYSYSSTIKNFSLSPLKSINELSGVYEQKPMFGIAYSQSLSKFTLYGFASSRLLDADIKDNCVKRVYYYTRYTDSLTQARKNQLRENLFGTRVSYLISKLCIIGTSFYCAHYDKPFAPTDSLNSFYGNSLYVAGFDLQAQLNNYFLKSELAYSIFNGYGFAAQIIGDWQYFKVHCNIYGQQKNFFSPHSRSKSLSNRKDNLSSSFNVFYNLAGFKMYVLASTKQDFVQESLPARIQYRLERRQDKFHIALTLKSAYKETTLKTYGTRLDLAYQFSKSFTLSSRIEDRYVTNKSGYGRLLQLGARYNFSDFQTESRIYFYNITCADCKIYAYEPIRNSVGFSAQGTRLSASLAYKIRNVLNLNWYLGFTKSGQSNIDSGLQFEINF